MKNGLKKRNLFLVGFLFSVFLISLVSSANTPSFESPASGTTTLTGTAMNLSVTFDTNGANYDNATFFYRTLSEGAWTFIQNKSNTSAAQTTFSIVWDTTTINDTQNVEINVTFHNVTASNQNATFLKNLSIDNGAPSCSYASASVGDTKEIVSGIDGIKILTSADNSRGLNNCSVNMNSLVTNLPDTSNTCDATFGTSNFSLVAGTTYTYYTNHTDGNGNVTQCGARTVKIIAGSVSGGGGGGLPTTTDEEDESVRTEGIISQTTSSVSNFFTQTIPNLFKSMWNAITFWN